MEYYQLRYNGISHSPQMNARLDMWDNSTFEAVKKSVFLVQAMQN